MSMRTIENTPYDYTRLELFKSRAKLTIEQSEDIDLIFRDLVEHLFGQINLVMDMAIEAGLKKHHEDWHATN